ncbi:putative membrane protein [Geomicrobium halophilum]|uniref:Putative membrane protein n=1 Tax=Geomicrobium halophilum TaxID=549000 RepID=A0A841PWU3_9BACL|nr:hypothetical protein [Geomicrobium halophilum]MBB6451001.1 putative membrane protein [Geomicrobium halophilum]
MHNYVRNMIAIVVIVPVFITIFHVLFNHTFWFAGFTIAVGFYALYLNFSVLMKERKSHYQ